jgi:quercetin dioxygenase-like cupin family protein
LAASVWTSGFGAHLLAADPARASRRIGLHETHFLCGTGRHPVVWQRTCGCADVEERQGDPRLPARAAERSWQEQQGRAVEYGPGGYSPYHFHPKSAFIYATVLEGAIRSQVNDGPVTTYKAGQSFSELPGERHGVSANASNTRPAKLLAVFVVDTKETELTIPCGN